MATISLQTMRQYLSRSISSLNLNKLNGLLAEIDFRDYLEGLGYGQRVSMGGWIARSVGAGTFGHNTIVIFPEIIATGTDYPPARDLPNPPLGLHTICSTFHQIGIRSYFCSPRIAVQDDQGSITWHSLQLGLPSEQQFQVFPCSIDGFSARPRRYGFLRYHTDVGSIPEQSVPEEFSKEHLRVHFQGALLSEMSDIDGILWGNEFTYPLEIKEKTPAADNKLGEYFGLDLGPFVKLAFYAAKRGNLHSIFVVREIDDVDNRNLVQWWFIKFEQLAQYASWVSVGGGTSMTGGRSSVVRVPKAEFRELNEDALRDL